MGNIGKNLRIVLRCVDNQIGEALCTCKSFRVDLAKLPKMVRDSLDMYDLERECRQSDIVDTANINGSVGVIEVSAKFRCNLKQEITMYLNQY